MRILADTNVIIDYMMLRDTFGADAEKIITACQSGMIQGTIAAHSVTDISYILRKEFTPEERRQMLLDLLEIFHVEGIDDYKLKNALQNETFPDFEDCLQMECALSFGADYIVTRDKEGFPASSIPCVTPKKFCEIAHL